MAATETVLTALAETARRVAEQVSPSAVRVGRHGGRGAGIVIADGAVLTNAHNLRDRTTSVTFADGRSEQGEVSGVDPDGDLVVLSVDTGGVASIEWASEPAALGDAVFAVSLTRAGTPRVTFGIVSGVDRTFRGPRGRAVTGSVEHTAPLARGSSGSPLLDSDGRLIGLNTNRLGDGFYLALPADADLRARVDGLARGESPQKVTLGVGVAPPRVARKLRASVGLPERDGLLIRFIDEDSPADQAGLKVGDLLTAAGDVELTSVDDLHRALDEAAQTGSLALHVVRGTDELDITVDLEPPVAQA